MLAQAQKPDLISSTDERGRGGAQPKPQPRLGEQDQTVRSTLRPVWAA